MIKRILILFTISLSVSIHAEQVTAHDMEQVIKALEFARAETALAANTTFDLLTQSQEAIHQLDIFKMIDVLLQACIHTASRVKNYEDNGLDLEGEIEDILTDEIA